MTVRSYDLLTTRKGGVEMSNALKNNVSYNLTTLTTKNRKGWGEVVVERFAREGVGRKDVRDVRFSPKPPCLDDAPASPCTGSCGLDSAGLCRGCGRTGAEIAGWRGMADAGKRAVLARLAGRGVGADEERA